MTIRLLVFLSSPSLFSFPLCPSSIFLSLIIEIDLIENLQSRFRWVVSGTPFPNMYVLFCFVLFCFVLFCFVLFCFVLFCFVLFCFVLFCFVLFCFVLFGCFYSFNTGT